MAQTGVPAGPNGAPGGWQPFDVSPVKGQVEITVDASGQVFMRGVVTSEEAGREIEEAARSVPGVIARQSQFQVLPRRGAETKTRRRARATRSSRAGSRRTTRLPHPSRWCCRVSPKRPGSRGAGAERAKAAASGPAGLEQEA